VPVSIDQQVTKPLTLAQRSAQTLAHLQVLVGRNDAKLLAAAVAAAAADEAEHNGAFVAAIQSAYDRLESATKRTTRRPTTAKPSKELIPIIPADEQAFDRDEKPSAYVLQRVYGNAQLRDALDGYTLVTLKEMAQEVMERNPGTKPASQRTKVAIIDYIVATLTGSK
jgi:hypothetical protein